MKLRVNMISETTFTVQGHGVHTAFEEMTRGLAARDDIDIKVNSWRHADITHVQTVGPYSLAALLWGRSRKIISAHVIPDSFTGSLVGARYWYGLSRVYLKFIYNRADRILAVSDEVKTALEHQMKVKPPVEVVFNTVSRELYRSTPEQIAAARDKLGYTAEDFMVVCVGQVQPRKRFDVFSRLADDHPEMKFVWVGGIPFKHLGADYEHMQQLMNDAPSNLTVTGVIPHEEVRVYLRAAGAFLLPSDQENHPLAVLEAAAADLPVVVRDIPQYDSSFGHTILRGTDDSFGAILVRLRDDADYRADAVAESRRIAEQFDTTSGAQRLVDIYRQVLEAR